MTAVSNYFVVVQKTSSWLRIGEVEELMLTGATQIGPCRIIFRTRYVDEGFESQIPRELWAEIVGYAPSFNDALNHFGGVAHEVAEIMSLSANAYAGELEYHLVYDGTPDQDEHEFYTNFLLEETGLPKPARKLDTHVTLQLIKHLASSPDKERIQRAIGQYHIALSYWQLGKSILSLAHLWIACENLTKVVLERECKKLGFTDPKIYNDQLASAWEIDKKELDGSIRSKIIFGGDTVTYKMAKEASNEFEHGFAEFSRIRLKADATRIATAQYIRKSIIELLDLPADIQASLLSDAYLKPLGATGYKRWLFATLKGSADNLAPKDKLYPELKWGFGIKYFRKKADGHYDIAMNQTLQAHVGEGVKVTLNRFEMYGPEGMTDINPKKLQIEHLYKDRRSIRLLQELRAGLLRVIKRLDKLILKLQNEHPARVTSEIQTGKIKR